MTSSGLATFALMPVGKRTILKPMKANAKPTALKWLFERVCILSKRMWRFGHVLVITKSQDIILLKIPLYIDKPIGK